VYIIVFIAILALLVLVHEFGHYWVAKKSGMKVEEFGFGFPPRLFGIKRGETLYSVNLLPLGGFVKIVGENNDNADDPRSFGNRPFMGRLLTLIAGVVMNFVLACILLAIGFGIGLPTVVESDSQVPKFGSLSEAKIAVLQISPESPAATAGLKEGDQVKKIDGNEFSEISPAIEHIKSKAGQNIAVEVLRGDETVKLDIASRANPPEGEGALGVALGKVGELTFPWWYTPVVGVKAAWHITTLTVDAFVDLIFKGQGVESLGGPVKIAVLTGQVAKLGIAYLIQFTAFLSVNLAVLNILPFPALDGGRVLFLIIEKIRGKKNNPKIEQVFNAVGFALLLLLIVWITARDVISLI
jgi:regulator of sigma E protease